MVRAAVPAVGLMHENSKLLFARYARHHFRAGMAVLEIGPDASPSTYEAMVGDTAVSWSTAEIAASLDLDSDRRRFTGGAAQTVTHVMPTEYEIPVDDGTFDIVLAGQVIEHVRRIWRWLPELARVCQPGGLVIILSPVSWPLHEAPVDCWRIYPEGMQTLCDEAGLDVETCLWETLEVGPDVRTCPGESFKAGRRSRLKMRMGWPVEAAYDLITIARKP